MHPVGFPVRTIANMLKHSCCWIKCLVPAMLLLLLLLLSGISGTLTGCKGTTVSPTEPGDDPTPEPGTPVPTATVTPTVPEGEATPTPSSPSYDGYADTPDDPAIKTLEPGDEEYEVTLEYTGDIDWYKIAVPANTETLTIALEDIPSESDFDIVAYDENIVEIPNGRSTQAGNESERIELENPGELVYLQIYAYSGRGTAILSLTAKGSVIAEIDQLSFEDVLRVTYPLYPRGTSSSLLERAVEEKTVDTITCKGTRSTLTGMLTIGTFAHVERNILTLTDYVDGWALAVFNGSMQHLDEMRITMTVSIASEELGLVVKIPPDMRDRGDQYTKSNTKNDVYHVAVTYGDLWGSNSKDIRISSGVVGDLGTLLSNRFFQQEVTTDWEVVLPDGTRCSGRAEGAPIQDFEAASKAVSLLRHPSQRIW